MKLVIDIPDYNLDDVQNGSIACGQILKAVKEGTPLPKGHGELIDKDIVLDMMNYGILEEYINVMGGVIPADK